MGVGDEWVLEGMEGALSVYSMPVSAGFPLGIKLSSSPFT